ncbi:MAG: glucoamylase family protein [Flavobacterium sp.]|uniref:glucoamylase family protein n=1 Tax=Flavobacterium sp. TaxID=239 RepID=UPI00261DC68F|nr:glucoamylase family protein [Flavobacterium sp.]MDD5149223.1 glucoamylase family protein [Flavobacterium sp.]
MKKERKYQFKYFSILTFLFLIFSSCSKSNEFVSSDLSQITPAVPISYSDVEVLDKVQQDDIKYFWEYAETNSKLARERYHTDDPGNDANIVTTGGSGFGLMTLVAGIERGFVNRAEAVSRLTTALTFLENADRFHGAWPHWMDGRNGKVIPFGTLDNGGDLVETAFLCQGLLTLREYFKNGTTQEQALSTKADYLWKGVEWDWYTKGGENVLYWHWSPTNGWQMNLKIEGYNECLITYILAASSPTHPISKSVYTLGWAKIGGIVSGGSQYGIPVVFNYSGANGSVGPLFWAHYSYLGLDPRGLTDNYANYFSLVQNQAKINVEYAKVNTNRGYSDTIWGLTASYTRNSDGTTGYNAHSVTNDTGIISPTAALSSMPYTPVESLKFLHYLYEQKPTTLVGIAGPYDAFSPAFSWVTPRYLAIDQGTIVPMIENYRTGLLWRLFMNAPEVKQGLINLDFHSTQYGF